MKKSQIVVFALAIVLVLAFAIIPELMAPQTTEEPGGDITWTVTEEPTTPDQVTDPKPEAVPVEGNMGTEVEPEPELEPEPTPIETPEPEVRPTSTVAYDLGPDIELGEGITDARLEQAIAAENVTVEKGGSYTSKVEVALYIHKYGRVPDNYISKTKARNAGWVNTEGNLWDVLPGKSIGGGGYYNEGWGDEPILPETPEGRDWRECDINYQGGYRGAERLVYSDDGLIFYTGDHYESFERLY